MLPLLQQVKIFDNTPTAVLEQLSEALKQQTVEAGAVLTRKGEPGDCMFVMETGRVKVHDGDFTIAELGAGEVVGEFSLLDTEPRSATVTALEPTRLYRLDQADFYRIVLPHAEAMQAVLKYVLARLRAQNQKIIDDLKRREEELAQKVAERTQELSQQIEETIAANDQLAHVNANKNEIISIVSHDIRSPLTGIGSLAAMLQDRDVAADADQVVEFAKLISSSATNITKFVNDILDLAKLESGTSHLNKEKLNLETFLRSLNAQFEPLTITKSVKLVLNIEESLTAPADSAKLSQGVNNILANSFKFTPSGGTITLALKRIQHEGKDYAAILISDTGIGIPKEAIPGLFDKFNKIQRTGTKGEKGTGLGMSIAKQIIDMHDGHIMVDSEEGKGTTFSLLLPLQETASAA